MKKVIQIALLLFLVAPALARAEALPEIRVLVIDGVNAVTIESLGSNLRLVSDSGRGNENIGQRARVAASNTGLALNGAGRGNELSFINTYKRYRIGDRTFKGTLTVIKRGNGSLAVIDKISIEDYLAGLINSEISSTWPIESIKAQAIAARTYAMNQIEGAKRAVTPRPYDITSTMLDQVYDGAHREDSCSIKAVRATRGEALLRDGNIFPSYYHSCCGGQTEYAHNVWTGEKGPPIIDDPYCEGSPKFNWTWQTSIPEFMRVLREQNISLKIVRSVATSALFDSPRVGELIIEGENGMIMVKATDLRKFFGYQNIKSTWFDAAIKGSDIVFSGKGYGHGVGLCQWGAKGMADKGIGYRDILKFYYPDADVLRMY